MRGYNGQRSSGGESDGWKSSRWRSGGDLETDRILGILRRALHPHPTWGRTRTFLSGRDEELRVVDGDRHTVIGVKGKKGRAWPLVRLVGSRRDIRNRPAALPNDRRG